MKFTFLLVMLLSSNAHALPEHFDLEMTSQDYKAFLSHAATLPMKLDPTIERTISMGTRLLDWVTLLNANRPIGQKLELTNPNIRAGIPIETPNSYNPQSIQKRLDAALRSTPDSVKSVLSGTGDFPTTLPISDASFLAFARTLNGAYQTAARWKSLIPYQNSYVQRKSKDVRGYYFLNKNGWDSNRLAHLSNESAATQNQVKSWLKMECLNSGASDVDCGNQLAAAIQNGILPSFYERYHPIAAQVWNQFFAIPANGARKDVVWKVGSPEEMIVPFNTPSISAVFSYLKDNIEAEWQTPTWFLHLNFGNFDNGPRVEFKPGVVPHANALGGNIITMDQNASLDEYEVKWTIRHEFGHIIGFPDCYLEFYDTDTQAFVQYQLDITDIMCSRKGNFKTRHYDELKRVYAPH